MMPDFKTEIEILPGWCSETKFRDIYETVRASRAPRCVEIGVHGGRSLLAFAHGIKDSDGSAGFVFGIDPYDREKVREGGDGAENHDWWTQEALDTIYAQACELLSKRRVGAYSVILRDSSEEAHKKWHPDIFDFDFLHIDGNHSELCSCRDVSLYLPLAEQGGIIYFDDINWPTTLKAQSMLAEQCDLLRVVDQCAVYRKR